MNWLERLVKGNLLIIAFGLLAVYTFINGKILEGIVYTLMATGFGLMDIVRSGKYPRYKKELNIASWVVILGAVLLFIALLRQDAYSF